MLRSRWCRRICIVVGITVAVFGSSVVDVDAVVVVVVVVVVAVFDVAVDGAIVALTDGPLSA